MITSAKLADTLSFLISEASGPERTVSAQALKDAQQVLAEYEAQPKHIIQITDEKITAMAEEIDNESPFIAGYGNGFRAAMDLALAVPDLILRITTAYEQGYGMGLKRRSLDNPYVEASFEAMAWDEGYEEGAERHDHVAREEAAGNKQVFLPIALLEALNNAAGGNEWQGDFPPGELLAPAIKIVGQLALSQSAVAAETIHQVREAWATLTNLSSDMEDGPLKQQMARRAQQLRHHLNGLELPDGSYKTPTGAMAFYPLPDELYSGSKDWISTGYAGRVDWLHSMYEARSSEVDNCYDMMANAGQRFATAAARYEHLSAKYAGALLARLYDYVEAPADPAARLAEHIDQDIEASRQSSASN